MDEEEEIEGLPAFFHRHPLLLCFLLFMAFTYIFVYPVFSFILASAPVLILTAFLLGLVLLNSVPQDHDPHVYKKISHRPPQCQPSTTAIGGSRRHHHRPSDESPPTSDSSSSSAEENDNPPTMSTATSHASFPDTAANSESESTDSEHEEKQQNHRRSEKKEAVRVVAWTADDDKSIENIGSLELEMNATVEKLMSRRRARGHQRPLHHHHHHVMDLVDIDDPSKLSIATRKSNPFDLDVPYDEDDNFPDSAPSMLGLRPSRNPFFDDTDDNDLRLHTPQQPSSQGAGEAQKNAMLFRRHESFTVGAPYTSDFRPSRFRPYFVTEKMQGQPVTVPEASRKSSSSSTSSSSAGANAYAYAYAYASANKEEEEAVEQEALAEAQAEAEATAMLEEVKPVEYSSRSHEVVAVDVELISDSSDDDMLLPGGNAEKEQQVKLQQQVAEQEQQIKVAEQELRMKVQQQQQQQQLAEQEQQMKVQQQLAEQEQRMKVQQQQLAEQEQRMKVQQQQQEVAEQERQMKAQQQQQLAVSDDDDEGDSFEVESITKQVAAAAAGKTKQLETDPAYDYSPSAPAGKTEKKQQEAFAQLPPVPPNKLQSMRRVFSEEDADEPWAAPSGLEEMTTTAENEGREQDMFPLPRLPESAPSAGGAPPLSAAAKKAIGKSTKYKPPSKKAVLGFFRK